MAKNPTPAGMFIHFDPNKIILPPIFGGPQPPDQLAGPSHGIKRKRGPEGSIPSTGFFNIEKALQEAADNELNHVLKLGESSCATKSKKIHHGPGKKNPLQLFDTGDQLMSALQGSFQDGPDVDFAGSYPLREPGVSHKQRIQTITHEIWKATGYRFTVKDHPRTKSGHKTRLWCSQDEAHRSKSSISSQKPRTSSEGIMLAKARYACRSGLLISSREEAEADTSLITVRMHHHVAHEPYYDNTLPPQMTQLIWENIGWGRKSRLPAPPRSDSSSDEIGDGLNHDIHETPPPSNPEEPPPLTPEIYQKRMRHHIDTIRDFCDGLEYQLPFNDFRMLHALESEGTRFLRLVRDCLEKEGRIAANAGKGSMDTTQSHTGNGKRTEPPTDNET